MVTVENLKLLASITIDRDVVDDCRRAMRGDVLALSRVARIIRRGEPSCPRK